MQFAITTGTKYVSPKSSKHVNLRRAVMQLVTSVVPYLIFHVCIFMYICLHFMECYIFLFGRASNAREQTAQNRSLKLYREPPGWDTGEAKRLYRAHGLVHGKIQTRWTPQNHNQPMACLQEPMKVSKRIQQTQNIVRYA